MRSSVVLLCCGIYLEILGILSSKSGPFESNLLRVENCKTNSSLNATIIVSAELYNTSKKLNLLRGNFSVIRPDSRLTLSVHDHFLVDGQWQQTFGINNLSCRSYLVSMMGKIFGISFNKRTCAVPKGTYTFKNVDFDFVDHVFAMSREYGKILRVVEVTNKRGTVVCLEFEFVVTPKKD